MPNLLVSTDDYKVQHKEMMVPGTNKSYSYLECRGSRTDGLDYSVFFGLQYYLKEYFSRAVTHSDVDHLERILNHVNGPGSVNMQKFRDLADLGYLPLRIKAVPEGTVMPLKHVMLTLTNTDPDFGWFVQYVESLLLKVWLPITVAANSYRFFRMFSGLAQKSAGHTDFVPFQMHDFGYRGTDSDEAARIAGAAHLLSFTGTDNLPAVDFLMQHYDAGNCDRPIGLSVPASEHSVMCTHSTDNDDKSAIKHLLDNFPSGIISVVSDTYDLFKAVGQYYNIDFHDRIMERDGKWVVRPDSGDPPNIICGDPAGETIEEQMGVVRLLEKGFGSTTNELGYKTLDPHVGCLYGDAIFYERAQQILSRLMGMGYSTENILFGSGGLLLNNWSRDTLGMALKATYCEVNGEPRPVEKKPKTDTTKTSKKGLLRLERYQTELGTQYKTLQNVTPEQEQGGILETVFEDGKILRFQNLDQVRDTLESNENKPAGLLV